MATGAPDYYNRSMIMGDDSGTLRVVKVDANGQMYIAMTGQSLEVGNLPSDYMTEGGNVAVPAGLDVNNQPSDYMTEGGNVAVPAGLDVNSSPPIQGEDEGTPHVVAVDTNGVILARLKGAFGALLKDIAVDTTGILLARLKGAFGGVLKDIAVDTNGVLLAQMKGMFGGVSKDIAVDTDGNMKATMTGDYEGTPKILSVDEDGRMLGLLSGQSPVRLNVATFRHCSAVSDINTLNNCSAVVNNKAYVHQGGCLWVSDTAGGAMSFFMNTAGTNWNYFTYISFYAVIMAGTGVCRFMLRKDTNNYRYIDIGTLSAWKMYNINMNTDMTEVGSCPVGQAVEMGFYMNGAESTKWIEIDWMRLSFDADFAKSLRTYQVNEYGGLPAFLYGLYDGSPVILNADVNGNLLLNIKAQDLAYQTSRTYAGTAYAQEISENTISGNNWITLLTKSGSGTLDGGWLRLYSDDAHGITSYVKVTLDGHVIASKSIEYLHNYGIDSGDKGGVFYTWYDTATHIFRWAFRQNQAFESTLLIQFMNDWTLISETLVGNIDYHLI